jgi:hypothetical protein
MYVLSDVPTLHFCSLTASPLEIATNAIIIY